LLLPQRSGGAAAGRSGLRSSFKHFLDAPSGRSWSIEAREWEFGAVGELEEVELIDYG
jgi:hypothetical protein